MIAGSNHTQLSNDFIDNHMRHLNPAAISVFIVITRKTTGWHKDTDVISLSQITELTGLSRSGTLKAIKELENKGLILVIRSRSEKGYNHTNLYTINYTPQIAGSTHSTQGGSTLSTPRGSTHSTQTKEKNKQIINKFETEFQVVSKGNKYKTEHFKVKKALIDNALEFENFTFKDFTAFCDHYNKCNWTDKSGNDITTQLKNRLKGWLKKQHKPEPVKQPEKKVVKYDIAEMKRINSEFIDSTGKLDYVKCLNFIENNNMDILKSWIPEFLVNLEICGCKNKAGETIDIKQRLLKELKEAA